MHASNGIMFNHESPIRARPRPRKITRAVGGVERGYQDVSISATSTPSATGGHDRDYVEGMWRTSAGPADD